MNEQDKIIRASDAASLLANPLLKAAFEDTKQKLVDGLETVRDDDTRNKLVLSLQLLRNIKFCIEDHIATGKIAENVLEKRSLFNRRGL